MQAKGDGSRWCGLYNFSIWNIYSCQNPRIHSHKPTKIIFPLMLLDIHFTPLNFFISFIPGEFY